MQLPLSFQVYSGRYKNPKTLATRVNKVQYPLELLRENVLVAVHIQSYKKPPVIGKVISVKDGSTFDIEYLKESWRKEWKSWKMGKIGLLNYQMGVYCLLISTWTRKIKSRKLTNTSERHIRIWKEIS